MFQVPTPRTFYKKSSIEGTLGFLEGRLRRPTARQAKLAFMKIELIYCSTIKNKWTNIK
jgi:hypothetical protein